MTTKQFSLTAELDTTLALTVGTPDHDIVKSMLTYILVNSVPATRQRIPALMLRLARQGGRIHSGQVAEAYKFLTA
jgi:hypothetical protein